jgi:hypothetical protein
MTVILSKSHETCELLFFLVSYGEIADDTFVEAKSSLKLCWHCRHDTIVKESVVPIALLCHWIGQAAFPGAVDTNDLATPPF